ncbi:RES family NAD+ phosphorylase [Noviherbaspirillum malthae]|uniref:RES family NAD+ phosphorylase n=1 Tax=Noviherbaspirillum malthae TaxID=1260987 RepID=UPI00188F4566|nr:RES domain-containing protein [Noviherbaspirillum malthae]
MTPLPHTLTGKKVVAWRLDQEIFASTWASGEGAFRVGGRWNSKGRRAVYCAIDPSTAILEVAVHKGFKALDTVPHVLTALEVATPDRIHVVKPEDVPNPNWLYPGIPSAGQQQFGDTLLDQHDYILLPSVVSRHSWNLIFDASRVAPTPGQTLLQERFALDPRLHPPLQ